MDQYHKDYITVGFYGIQDIEQKPYPVLSHDHGMAIFHHGKLLQHIQLERITRRKHDHLLKDEICNLLSEIGLLGDPKVDFIYVNNISGNSFCDQTGRIRFESPPYTKMPDGLVSAKGWYLDKQIEAYMLPHELAHLYSNIPFYGDFKEDSLLFHFDGGASISNASLWQKKLAGIACLDFGWKMKYLSELYDTNYLVFQLMGGTKQNQLGVPGKFMGYASLGKYDSKIEKWLEEHMYFTQYWGRKKDFLISLNKHFNLDIQNIDNKEYIYKNISATIQHIFIKKTLEYLKTWQVKTRAKRLYFSGGCALNIKLNSAIVNSGIFEDLFIPPCCNDSGLALGAAVALEQAKGHKVESLTNYVNTTNGSDNEYKRDEVLLADLADLISNGEIIGLCNGSGEIGPRALGNRSLIARADDIRLARKLSMEIKGREWFRPIAPVMLKSEAEQAVGKEVHHLASKMLLDFDVLPDFKQKMAGVIHEDGTSRIQTISFDENPFLFDLLAYLNEHKEIKALINTSFNIAGEPIVHTHKDAITSAKQMGVKKLVLDYQIISV